MQALVISGGGSKGAFAGGVAEFLINEMRYKYDIYMGTSTGSLLISHLALDKVSKIKSIFTSVDESNIFDAYPFLIREDKQHNKHISINHLIMIKSFIERKKTFGESLNLRKLIGKTLSKDEFEVLKIQKKEICVTVSNLSLNQIEYKSIQDASYEDFCDWIWISSNYVPFMSLVEKNGYEYADGGFGSMVPIEEAINKGAKIIDVIILETEVNERNQMPSKNVFSLLSNLHFYMTERIERQNIRIGKLAAINKGVTLNFYYTPTELVATSLIFDKKLMAKWWSMGYQYAKSRNENTNEFRI
ncbi:patatin-like phospholipase family protein [Sphingobacterium sp. N143]|uniref:patatin-like phospholipase family protein n=1 Tax=Sphingobacterium sp. N143 TaxID=2746727 RepID=UPI0025769984|nr:patatin-like phospholipase family protein [Sphingobacterium sp. N143]MDM1294957.1 patatin-like phospholipase family protein [Sphingobacterium sp. N143]